MTNRFDNPICPDHPELRVNKLYFRRKVGRKKRSFEGIRVFICLEDFKIYVEDPFTDELIQLWAL